MSLPTYHLEHGRHVARLHRRHRRARPRAIPLAMITMRKSIHGSLLLFYGYGAPLLTVWKTFFFTFSGEYFTDKSCCIALRCWLAHPSLFYSSHLKWNTFFIIITYITTVTVIAIIQKRTLLTKQHLHYNSYITYNTVLRQQ